MKVRPVNFVTFRLLSISQDGGGGGAVNSRGHLHSEKVLVLGLLDVCMYEVK